MGQSIFINSFQMSTPKELVNVEACLSDYVTELIDISRQLRVQLSGLE